MTKKVKQYLIEKICITRLFKLDTKIKLLKKLYN